MLLKRKPSFIEVWALGDRLMLCLPVISKAPPV